MSTAYRVGGPYPYPYTPGTDTPVWSVTADSYTLSIFIPAPSPSELRQIGYGELYLGLIIATPALFIVLYMGDAIPWCAIPYTIHQAPKQEQALPTHPADGDYARLHILVIDTLSNLIVAYRCEPLLPALTAQLATAMQAQADAPYDSARYAAQLARMQRKTISLATYSSTVSRMYVPPHPKVET